MHDKKECVIHMPNLRQALNHGLVLKKLNRVIKFNQETWQRKNLKQKFRSKKYNAFIREFNKIALSAIDFKEIQLTDSRRRRN